MFLLTSSAQLSVDLTLQLQVRYSQLQLFSVECDSTSWFILSLNIYLSFCLSRSTYLVLSILFTLTHVIDETGLLFSLAEETGLPVERAWDQEGCATP